MNLLEQIKQKWENALSGLKRLFSNESTSYRLYMFWGIATLIFFGLFGLYPVSKSLSNNIELSGKMYKTNNDLNKKIQELKKMKQDLDTVGKVVSLLETNLPDYYDPQNHMVELSLLISNSGFSFNRFYPVFGESSGNGYRDVGVSITGDVVGDGDLYDLIKDIESSSRLSEVKNIVITKSTDEISISMTIRSYIMEE